MPTTIVHPRAKPAAGGAACPRCERSFSKPTVIIDSSIANQFYRPLSKLILSSDLALASSTAHRIGGGGADKPRFRRAQTLNALSYCRAVHDNYPEAPCIIVDEHFDIDKSKCMTELSLGIDSPTDGSTIGPFPSVSGTAAEELEGEQVWLLIQPLGNYVWVQNPALVVRGKWEAKPQFGDPYTVEGHQFVFRAVIRPAVSFSPAQRFVDFPKAEIESPFFRVFLNKNKT